MTGATIFETLGANLRTARLRRNRTLEDIARAVGVGRHTLMRLERGDPGVSIGVLAQVLAAFEVSEQLAAVACPKLDPADGLIPADRVSLRASRPRAAR